MNTTDSSRVHFIEIKEKDAGQRVDNFIRKNYPGLPKSRIYQMLRKGEVRVNKKRVKPPHKLNTHDLLRLPPIIDGKHELEDVPAYWLQRIAECVLYEDENFLIINKPAGIAVHGGSNNAYGVISAVKRIWGENYAELAHRLDRDTTGCLVLGKHRHALQTLQEAMKNNEVKKTYLCLVKGVWSIDNDWLEISIKKGFGVSTEKMIVSADGKLARTYFAIEEQFRLSPYSLTLVKATLDTGRTHQIRVSVASEHSAVAGDTKYGDEQFNVWLKEQGYRGMFLHAEHIQFSYNDKMIDIHAPLPNSAQDLLTKLRHKHDSAYSLINKGDL